MDQSSGEQNSTVPESTHFGEGGDEAKLPEKEDELEASGSDNDSGESGNAEASGSVGGGGEAESTSEFGNQPEPGGSGAGETESSKKIKLRVLVVSNRLPLSPVRGGPDSWSFKKSAGGLVSALRGIKDVEAMWIAWAGLNVPDSLGQSTLKDALAEQGCVPIFLDEELVKLYYAGFCNNIIWPLFHYLVLPQNDQLMVAHSFGSQFEAYKRVNQMFSDAVSKYYREGDVVWCHDYHLMLLPKFLKEANSKMAVGWFLHIPFPSVDIYRTVPFGPEILRSILAADLIGFHTYDHMTHFLCACNDILGLERTPEGVQDKGRLTRVAVFPIGIESDRFKQTLELPSVKEHINKLIQRFGGRKVMLGVDRLDMIKGIPQKILAFETFLQDNPSWIDRVVLVQIAVPTRTDVPEYQKLTSKVHEIVGRINGRFGTITAVPIHHLDRSVDFNELCALYAVADVALVTSLRDGMNLVSYEFVACQDSKKGVLILSEFTGAAESLEAGALLVNPWNTTQVASSIKKALIMPTDEREKMHMCNYAYVTTHTSQKWAETFLRALTDTAMKAQSIIRQEVPLLLPAQTAIQQYLQSKNRLLILGFNATMTESIESPGRTGSDEIKELKLHPDLRGPLATLCNDAQTTVVVLSGSDRNILDKNFGGYNMWLAAENGMFLRHTSGDWMKIISRVPLNMDWAVSAVPVFELFTRRTPRSYYDHRDTSIVWDYKHADLHFGMLQARDMFDNLSNLLQSNAEVDVIRGSRSVEVRNFGVTKGAAIGQILKVIVQEKNMVTPIDYVLCIGHFLQKDENIYTFFEEELSESSVRLGNSKKESRTEQTFVGCKRRELTSLSPRPFRQKTTLIDLKDDKYFSCAVDREYSKARYQLPSSDHVVSFLIQLEGHIYTAEQ
ncbi:alpha,alpha-trehalose-phosphate synthase [Canna indica]|uniref:alpha,alpha-trehalose-phosphate synthase (UDP-forming) n=1 Tax=Canna indica TaxID=4628 RepID=A0AAQ3QJ12_9LILI|nr:alpha,alpha-trehalose-phosphate synthase [Canna indica]